MNLTLSEENQFSFVCPLFDVTTKMAQCMKLRELKWMGRPIVNKEGQSIRRGCQAAMDCGKCPAAEAVSQIIYSKAKEGVPDFYGSKTPVVGKLRTDLLQRIRAAMMRESVMEKYGVPDAERALLETANSRIDAQLKVAPKGEGNYSPRFASDEPVTTRRRTTARSVRRETPVVSKQQNDAALTGDLAAAINS